MTPNPEEPITIEILDPQEAAADQAEGDPNSGRVPDLADLPKEVGYILLSAGVLGFVLPGPGTPAIIAGGLVLWPKGFGKAEVWFQHRFPSLHRGGMQHVRRFLNDLETRYPGTLRR